MSTTHVITEGPVTDERGRIVFSLRIERDGKDVTAADLNPVRVTNMPDDATIDDIIRDLLPKDTDDGD